MWCAQFADSAKFGILVNLFNIFLTNFGCFFATPQPFTIGFGPNYAGMWYIIVVYWIVLFFADSSISLFYTNYLSIFQYRFNGKSMGVALVA